MAMNGFVKTYGTAGMPARVCAYDDGLLVLKGKGAGVAVMFGAIGGALARRSALKKIQEAMATIREQPTAAAAAAAVDGAVHLPADQITRATIGKAAFGAKKLTIEASSGTTTQRFHKREQTVHEASQVLGAVLGDRLQVESTD